MFKYADQAEALISILPYFKKQEFERWYKENNKYILYQDLLNYLITVKQIGIFELIKELASVEIDRELVFAEDIKDLLGKVNVDLLKKFYIKVNSNIGDIPIYRYINRDKIKKQDFERKRVEEITKFLIDNFDKIKELIK